MGDGSGSDNDQVGEEDGAIKAFNALRSEIGVLNSKIAVQDASLRRNSAMTEGLVASISILSKTPA